LIKLLSEYDRLIRDYPHLDNASKADWARMDSNTEDMHMLNKIQDKLDRIQKYFVNKSKELYRLQAPVDSTIEEELRVESEVQFEGHFEGSSLYSDLVTVHLRNAVLADKFAEHNIKESARANQRYVYPEDMTRRPKWDKRMAETLGQYAHRWKYMMKDLKDLGWVVNGEVQFLEMWAHMMIRGFYWEFCHFMVRGPRVPVEYWDSKMPIYIG
jgi:hypothetical protein